MLHKKWRKLEMMLTQRRSGVMFDGTEVDAKFEGNWLVLSKKIRLQPEK